jgi:hypothetical protein
MTSRKESNENNTNRGGDSGQHLVHAGVMLHRFGAQEVAT